MNKVEVLRQQMIDMAEVHRSFTHPEVVAISQQLDVLINDVQQAQFRRSQRRVMFRQFFNSWCAYKSRSVQTDRQFA